MVCFLSEHMIVYNILIYTKKHRNTIYVIPTVYLYIYIVRKVLFAYSYFPHLFLFLISPSQSNSEKKKFPLHNFSTEGS